ncbi:PEGA domain-containing protein [Candidatus Saccharibacteria bacterium]|nr:PEGA domain-containing protein [Candidatus Saccharibacteria bacterium]
MDSEKLKRRQSFRVIISEFFMVMAVIITVIILAFLVSGYWLNSDLKVERQGMIQVSSIPTGADLDIDGESSWLQRTNTSKILASGEHTVIISKEGYDTWTKTVNISEGLLYRLHYPRLFLQDRAVEKTLDTKSVAFATVSPDRDKLLLIGDTSEWQVVNLKDDTLEPKKLNVSEYLPSVSLAEGATIGLFSGKILTADWDRDGHHVLFKIDNAGTTEWVLIDVENAKNSLNLSKEFGANFSTVKILDNSASNLLAIQNGNLHKIDIPGKLLSAVLIDNVNDFDHYEDEIIFSAADDAKSYILGLFKIGDSKIVELATSSEPFKVAISKFYDEMYLATLQGNQVKLYKKVDFAPVADFSLSFAPKIIEVGHNGEFITMYTDTQIATLDMETTGIREWKAEGSTFGWLDNDMIYSVAGGELIVYDFDGFNRRVIAKNVSDHFPVAISDNKWLYYFSDGNLLREKLIR